MHLAAFAFAAASNAVVPSRRDALAVYAHIHKRTPFPLTLMQHQALVLPSLCVQYTNAVPLFVTHAPSCELYFARGKAVLQSGLRRAAQVGDY